MLTVDVDNLQYRASLLLLRTVFLFFPLRRQINLHCTSTRRTRRYCGPILSSQLKLRSIAAGDDASRVFRICAYVAHSAARF